MGYDIADGPGSGQRIIYFESLNIVANHPAREADDSFYLHQKGMLLRTQCSNIQTRVMEKSQPPIAVFSPAELIDKKQQTKLMISNSRNMK